MHKTVHLFRLLQGSHAQGRTIRIGFGSKAEVQDTSFRVQGLGLSDFAEVQWPFSRCKHLGIRV